MRYTPEQREYMQRVARAFLFALKQHGDRGIPANHLYATVIERLSQHDFQQLMDGMLEIDLVRRNGNTYYFMRDLE